MLGILKKLDPKAGSVFAEGSNDLSEEGMAQLLPLAKTFIDPIIEEIKGKLGDDENIGVIRNVGGKLVLMLLKGDETDLDIKDPETTILETIDISEITDMLKIMTSTDDKTED